MEFEAAYPYINEAMDLWDICHERLESVEAASRAWLVADEPQATDDPLGLLPEWRRMPHQRRLLSEVEALLAAYARLSLLLHPSSPDRVDRGAALRGILELPDTSPLGDRDLRDSWMHFDERLDDAIAAKDYGSSERFVRAAEVTPGLTRHCVRVLAVDTLDIYIRGRHGEVHSTNLRALGEPLALLATAARKAHDKYTAPHVRAMDGTT